MEGREGGRKGERKEGRKEGREEGREEGNKGIPSHDKISDLTWSASKEGMSLLGRPTVGLGFVSKPASAQQENSYLSVKEYCKLGATWMDLEIVILSEVSQTEKDKYHMISLICGILKNGANELL